MSQLRRTVPQGFHDRRLHPMVIEGYGKSIDQVTDFVLLLKALRDAIAAHQEMILKQCIRIGGITIRNIAYAKDPSNLGEGEGYGNLIDLEQISCHNLDDPTGTHAFHSIGILESVQKNKPYVPRYIDDLQGFFWVFVWILESYDVHPNRRVSKRDKQSFMHELFQAGPAIAATTKRGFLLKCISDDLEPWDPIIVNLVRQLGTFFFNRLMKPKKPRPTTTKMLEDEAKNTAPADYAEFLGHFDAAIKQLEKKPPISVVSANDSEALEELQPLHKESSKAKSKSKRKLSQRNTRLQASTSLASPSSIPHWQAAASELSESSQPRKKARMEQDQAA
ncbi:hypothetical protein CVT24_011410 [Panaeolus cyanescens]|uniref:Fungal-type protein kinase domain-containing protein n=1 Tax=Panaeolus cyanescens TaxID=181874 RepID=A0A409VG94_9AGAR|nr:hypothetical protein CVT24_011410 [Panaeolus cyanescens]